MILPRPISLPEANALVPHIVEGVARAREAMTRAYAARNEVTARAVHEGEDAILNFEERYPDLAEAAEEAEAEARDEMELLSLLGVVLMSVTPAMAAVSARCAGQPALLLWNDGDDEFAHWRLLADDEDAIRPIVDPDAFGEAAPPQ